MFSITGFCENDKNIQSFKYSNLKKLNIFQIK
jgi:hypothetical protein